MIEIYVDGRTFGKQGSGFSVILRSLSNLWKRSFSFGNLTANQSEIKAVIFGLMSVAESYKSEEVKLFVKNKYVKDMLDKDDEGCYNKVAKANSDLIDEMRNLYDTFKNITVDKNDSDLSDGKIVEECSKMVEDAVKQGEEVNYKK